MKFLLGFTLVTSTFIANFGHAQGSAALAEITDIKLGLQVELEFTLSPALSDPIVLGRNDLGPDTGWIPIPGAVFEHITRDRFRATLPMLPWLPLDEETAKGMFRISATLCTPFPEDPATVVTPERLTLPHDINERRHPVPPSVHQPDTPVKTRPLVVIDKTMDVTDIDQDGDVDGTDIQQVLDAAAQHYATTREYVRVRLNPMVKTTWLSRSLKIGSGVYLHGPEPGFVLIAGAEFQQNNGAYLIEFSNGTKLAGLHNIKLITNYKARLGAVYVGNDTETIYIYDNTFLEETADGSGRRDEKGPGTGIWMVRMGARVKRLFIDGNYFLHVPTGIFCPADSQFLHVTHNVFSEWRQRAIYLRNPAGGSIQDVHITHNQINPPKIGAIRQPIALQSLDLDSAFQRINVNYNSFYSPDLPYITEFRDGVRYTMSNNATADVISLHVVDGFQVIGNAIYQAGEVGITLALTTRNGTAAYNYIEGADTSAFSVGSSPNNLDYAVSNINLLSNTMVNPGRNRDNSLRPEYRSGIGSVNAIDCYYNGNKVIENDPRYDAQGNPLSLAYAYHELSPVNSTWGQLNEMEAPDHVVFRLIE